jgi:enhancer of polycomb-like protein
MQSLETNMAFPAFSEYEPVFSADLTPAFFATFTVPSWIPPTTQMLKFARAVYPYWRERRLDRRGHRIIPVLNVSSLVGREGPRLTLLQYDESDTKNESYVCFRRREVKTVRKTRASQVSYTDKLLRMQAEHELALGVATLLVQRETLKKDAIDAGLAVWQRRAALMDLRRKAPHLATKEDDELFIDKEVVRKPKDPIMYVSLILSRDTPLISYCPRSRPPHPPRRPPGEASPIVPPIETFVRPRERYLQVQAQIEKELAGAKLREKDWEDVIDVGRPLRYTVSHSDADRGQRPYQPRPVPYGERLFKYLHGSSNSKNVIPDQHGQRERQPVALRLRFGRGGRMHLDRRRPSLPPARQLPALTFEESEDEDMDDATRARLDVEIEESRQRQQERWKFDEDDGPAVGPFGSEEHDRVLYDDYQPR